MNDKSMIEIAKEIIEKSNEPMDIDALVDQVLEEYGCPGDTDKKAQLYIDITTSAEFVYCGDPNLWDLKVRQSLDLWDKSFYESEGATDEDEDELTLDDYNYVEEENDDEDSEDSEYGDDDEDEDSDDRGSYEIDEDAGDDDEDEEDVESWDDDDEEKYNNMMDDYEDLYDDK